MFDDIDRAYFQLRAEEERRRAASAGSLDEVLRHQQRAADFERQSRELELASTSN